jgi:hypothetical protein
LLTKSDVKQGDSDGEAARCVACATSLWYRIELAVSLAKADASPKVQTSVTEALHFRRADRFAADILWAAPDEVWRLLARKGYAEEIADPGAGRIS